MSWGIKFLILIFLVQGALGLRKQGVGVRGKLLCRGRPLTNTKVKIFDVDRNPGSADDLLDEGYTDADGEFQLDGTTRELTSIEPQLRIYHDCNDGLRECQRKFVHNIPSEYIHRGVVEKWYYFEEDLYPPEDNEARSCDGED